MVSFKEFLIEQEDRDFLIESLSYTRDTKQETNLNKIAGEKIHPLQTRAFHTPEMEQHGLHVVKIHNRKSGVHEFHITKSGWDGVSNVDEVPRIVSKHVHTILHTETEPYFQTTHKIMIQTADPHQYDRYKRMATRRIVGSNKKLSELGHIPLTSSPSISAPAFLIEYDLSEAMRVDGGKYASVISLYENGKFERLDVQGWLYPKK